MRLRQAASLRFIRSAVIRSRVWSVIDKAAIEAQRVARQGGH